MDGERFTTHVMMRKMPAGRVFENWRFHEHKLIWARPFVNCAKNRNSHFDLQYLPRGYIRNALFHFWYSKTSGNKSILLMRNTNNARVTHFDSFEFQRNIHHFVRRTYFLFSAHFLATELKNVKTMWRHVKTTSPSQTQREETRWKKNCHLKWNFVWHWNRAVNYKREKEQKWNVYGEDQAFLPHGGCVLQCYRLQPTAD